MTCKANPVALPSAHAQASGESARIGPQHGCQSRQPVRDGLGLGALPVIEGDEGVCKVGGHL